MTLEISHWFPPEIIREILLKASVKSLLRCKSVCKEWYSLISNQNFIKSHYTLSSTNNINYEHHRLIYTIYEHDIDLYSCPLYDVLFDKFVNNAIKLKNPLQQQTDRYQKVRIVGSCNGLVCLLVEDPFYEEYNTLFIYNPSTRRTNILPYSKKGAGWYCLYGFGYDETTNDYKVVKICRSNRTWPYSGTMIYSLKVGSWKEVGHAFAYPSNDGKFLNGALHWADADGLSGSYHIVYLDLGDESYGEVLQPEYDVEGDKRLTLGVLGEWLCVLCNYHKSRVLDIWVMKVYGEKDSWTKLACIPHPNTWWDPILDPLCISNDGKVLLRLGPQIVVYDSKDNSSSEIENFDKIREACIVVESLVSPFHP